MKVCKKLGINAEIWKEKSLEEFKKLCKGYVSPKETEAIWKEFKKLNPSKKKVDKSTEKEGGK